MKLTRKDIEDAVIFGIVIYVVFLLPYLLIWQIWKIDVLSIFFNFVYHIFN